MVNAEAAGDAKTGATLSRADHAPRRRRFAVASAAALGIGVTLASRPPVIPDRRPLFWSRHVGNTRCGGPALEWIDGIQGRADWWNCYDVARTRMSIAAVLIAIGLFSLAVSRWRRTLACRAITAWGVLGAAAAWTAEGLWDGVYQWGPWWRIIAVESLRSTVVAGSVTAFATAALIRQRPAHRDRAAAAAVVIAAFVFAGGAAVGAGLEWRYQAGRPEFARGTYTCAGELFRPASITTDDPTRHPSWEAALRRHVVRDALERRQQIRIIEQTAATARYLVGSDDALHFVSARKRDGRWTANASSCRPALAKNEDASAVAIAPWFDLAIHPRSELLSLAVGVEDCDHIAYDSVEVEETEAEVRVAVIGQEPPEGVSYGCAGWSRPDALALYLAAPLGNRRLVDAGTWPHREVFPSNATGAAPARIYTRTADIVCRAPSLRGSARPSRYACDVPEGLPVGASS